MPLDDGLDAAGEVGENNTVSPDPMGTIVVKFVVREALAVWLGCVYVLRTAPTKVSPVANAPDGAVCADHRPAEMLVYVPEKTPY